MVLFFVLYISSLSNDLFTETHCLSRSEEKKIPYIHAFSVSNTSISNARLKLVKNQADAKQHREAELLLFENYSHFSSTLSSKKNRTYSKK